MEGHEKQTWSIISCERTPEDVIVSSGDWIMPVNLPKRLLSSSEESISFQSWNSDLTVSLSYSKRMFQDITTYAAIIIWGGFAKTKSTIFGFFNFYPLLFCLLSFWTEIFFLYENVPGSPSDESRFLLQNRPNLKLPRIMITFSIRSFLSAFNFWTAWARPSNVLLLMFVDCPDPVSCRLGCTSSTVFLKSSPRTPHRECTSFTYSRTFWRRSDWK